MYTLNNRFKKYFILLISLTYNCLIGQVAINQDVPNSTLSVSGSISTSYIIFSSDYTVTDKDYFLSFEGKSDSKLTLPHASSEINGRIHYVKNNSKNFITIQSNSGQVIQPNIYLSLKGYVLEPDCLAKFVCISDGDRPAYWSLTAYRSAASNSVSNVTKFLSGTVSTLKSKSTDGTLEKERIINGGGDNYNIANLSVKPTAGGITRLYGKGYKISNPSDGVFDIEFDDAFEEIVAISTNIVDQYVTGDKGENPQPGNVGKKLWTTEVSSIGYISPKIIRIYTSNNKANYDNRSFTFVIIGN